VECELEGVLDSLPTRSRVLHSKIFPEGRKGRAHHLYTIVPAAAIVMGRTPLVGVNIGYQNRDYAVAVRSRFRLVATK